jgi:hypothetical protein
VRVRKTTVFELNRAARALLSFLAASTFAAFACAGPNVLTNRVDNARTGANLSESILSPASMSALGSFGKLWTWPVSGSVLAQPLYVQFLTIPGKGVHNVLYVATMNDVVYAFDADSSSSTPLWSVDLTAQIPGATPVPINNIIGDASNIVGNVGIASTPQIDLATHTMYLVARTLETSNPRCGALNGNYCQRLHALDITTGAEKFGGPVTISGLYAGLTFDPKNSNQRAGLALANGQIYIAWGSHQDENTYHGWVMTYDASTLRQTAVFSTTPNKPKAGIWMSGRAPAVDASGNVYYMVGNSDSGAGGFDNVSDFSESLLKFPPTGSLFPIDWFAPANWASLDNHDQDFGSAGPLLIPGTDLIAGAGKSSTFYLMHTSPLGAGGVHEQVGNSQIVQSLVNNGGELESGPAYWNHTGGLGPTMYEWSNDDYLKAYHFNGTSFDVTPTSTDAPLFADIGGALAISANGSTAGTGIVWATTVPSGNSDNFANLAVLRAFDADNLQNELFESDTFPTLDGMGYWAKFNPPTVANGRVYVASLPPDGTGSTAIFVYGLRGKTYPKPAAIIAAQIVSTLLLQ